MALQQRCSWCGKLVNDLAFHYGSDECEAIVGAFGAITPEGKQRESKLVANEPVTGEPQPKIDNRRGFCKKATECRECGDTVFKHGRCEQHHLEYTRNRAKQFYLDNREKYMEMKRERRYEDAIYIHKAPGA